MQLLTTKNVHKNMQCDKYACCAYKKSLYIYSYIFNHLSIVYML